jgi:hypothetical protein
MLEWELTSSVRAAMEARLLKELAINPVEHLVRVLGFSDEILNLFEFIIQEDSDPQATHIFSSFTLFMGKTKNIWKCLTARTSNLAVVLMTIIRQ